jgi:tetratricopeptide (TPR) repeat protein
MSQLQYLDFELVIQKEGSQYQARVVRSPVGEAHHTFGLPFSDLELENFVLRLGATSRGRRRIRSPEMQLARQFGSRLFEAVFRGDVRASFVSGQNEAERRGCGLRLKLRLDAPELINVPWEYLYDESLGRFLSLFEETPIVRYMDMRGSIVPLRVDPPLSVLVMLSRPSDHQTLDVEREKENLESALSELIQAGILTVTVMETATLPALADALLRERYHIFHYIGHGGFDERSQDGVLVLEDAWGRGHLASGERMAVLLGNHPTLRLVLLNACEGARTSRDDPFAGTATTLLRTGGLPAVVAMQFTITDEAAITFARGFYTALSVGRPVDAAVSHARLAIFAGDNDVEWGTPVLYMRAPDGRIFDVASLTPEVRAARRRAAEAARAEREAAKRRAREQQEARLAELYERATGLLAQRDWEGAQEVLATLQELAPGYRDVSALVEQARLGVEEEERCAALYRDAQKDLEAGRLPEAMAGFQSVLDLDPDHEGAARQLAEAQAQAEQQEAEARAHREAKARQKELDRVFAAAEAAAQAGDWSQAIESFEQVLKLDEAHEDAAARLDQARAALAREEAERQRQARLAERYDRACARMEAQDWPEAGRLLREIEEEEPDYRDVEARLAQVIAAREMAERLEQLYRQAEEAYRRAAWKRAETLFKQVLALQPGYREAEARRAEAQRQQQLAERYSQAWAHLQARRWTKAIESLEALVEAEPGYGHPVRGSAADLLARARQEKERAGMPAPPSGKRRRPPVPPEEAESRKKRIVPPDKEVERRLRERYTAGLSAFWLEEWEEACGHFQAILDERPGYEDAADKLAKAQRHKKWHDLYAQAQAARQAGNWKAALSALEELVAENPEYKDAAALLDRTRQDKERAGMPAPPAGKRRRPTGLPEEIKRRDRPTDLPT